MKSFYQAYQSRFSQAENPKKIIEAWCASYVARLENEVQSYISSMGDVKKSKEETAHIFSNFDITPLSQALTKQLTDQFFNILQIEMKARDLKPSKGKGFMQEGYKLLNKLNDTAKKQGYDDFGNELCEKYPLLTEKLELHTQNFIDNTKKILERVVENYSILLTGFFQENPLQPTFYPTQLRSNVLLKRITLSGSDPHKLGEQVAMLEFEHIKAPEKSYGQVVYKPSSVMADAQITGDVRKLKQVLRMHGENTDEYTSSFVEIMNENLNKESQLPTYLICPRKGDDIGGDYGFIQFLSQAPRPKIDFETTLYDWLSVFKVERSYRLGNESTLNPKMEKLWNLEFRNEYLQLKKASQPIHNVFTLDDEKEKEKEEEEKNPIERYSFQCGLLLYIASTLRITDLHNENMIVHDLKPYLIDLECSFQQFFENVINTHLLDPAFGAYSPRSTSVHTFNFFMGANVIQVNLDLPELNRIYVEHENKLVPIWPQRANLIEGFAEGAKILSKNRDRFMAWLNSPGVQSLVVRTLPFSTDSLTRIKEELEKCATEEEWQTKLEAHYQNEVNGWLSNLRAQAAEKKAEHEKNEPREKAKETDEAEEGEKEDPYAIKIIRDETRRSEASVSEALRREHVEAQFKSGSIPVYYTPVNGQELLDYRHEVISFGLDQIRASPHVQPDDEELLKQVEAEGESSSHYYKAPPMDRVKETMSVVGSEESLEASNKFIENLDVILEVVPEHYSELIPEKKLENTKAGPRKTGA